MAKNEAKIKFTAETQEFNQNISAANSEMQKLRAELKLNETQMKGTGTSVEGLKGRISLLDSELKASKDKVEALSQKVDKAAEIFGENSTEVQKLKTQLANAQTQEEKIRQEIDKCNTELSEQGTEFEETEKKAGKFGETLKTIGGVALKGLATAAATATVAVAGLVKNSVEEFADYEQLVGGVETLFGAGGQSIEEYAKSISSVGIVTKGIEKRYEKLQTAQDTVLENAADAYKTAGLSANEYMETVTSFAASLTQSLGGDTVAAANMADMAITDMADNANKMGTDMSSIQNAYQGFAKQNYSMLDNLKLGYGGTQKEMYRLMQDAAALDSTFADTAVFSLDEKNHLEAKYSDIVQAIHIVQTEMGITGTTAKEASTTISGSVSSMKAAWSNMLLAVADDTLPFDEYVNNFVDSVTTVIGNLLPRITTALGGVVNMVDQLAPVIIGALPGLVSALLPSVIDAAMGLVNAFVSVLPGLGQAIVDVIPSLIEGFASLVNSVIEALPSFITTIVNALPTIIPALVSGLVSVIVTLCENIGAIVQPIIDALPTIIISIVDAIVTNLPVIIEGLITLVLAIVDALPQILQALVSAAPTVIEMIVTSLLENLPMLISGLAQVVIGLVASLPEIFISLVQGFVAQFTGIWNACKNVFSDAGGWFSKKFTEAKDKASAAWSNAKEKFGQAWTKVQDAFAPVGNWFSTKFTEGKNNAVNAWSTIKSSFTTIKNNVTSAFSDIKTKLAEPFEKARDVIKGVADKIKGFFTGKIQMPKISLPHFGIEPKGWKIGDLLKGSIPKLKIDWYAEGGIMTRPTLFGWNGSSLMAGGEAGHEAILPIEKLQDYIANVIDSRVLSVDMSPLTEAIEDLANRPVEMSINGKKFASATASDTDNVNGIRNRFKSRGLAFD